jgi:hypothetical protein
VRSVVRVPFTFAVSGGRRPDAAECAAAAGGAAHPTVEVLAYRPRRADDF